MKTFIKRSRISIISLLALINFGLFAQNYSAYCDYLVGTNENAKAYISIETKDNGDFVMSITPYANDKNTAFRNNGYADGCVSNMTVNEESNTDYKYFTRTISEDKLEIIFTPQDGMMNSGDIIYIKEILEYKTTGDDNLWPTYEFTYVYGSTCSGIPTVITSLDVVTFTPKQGDQTFTVSAENLIGDIMLTAPKGLKITPTSISPDEYGAITNESVTITWTEGSSGNNAVSISGGGLLIPKVVTVVSNGFSDYCNKVLNYYWNEAAHPIYLTIVISEDKKDMIFEIAPVYGEVATWNANSIPVEQILVNESTLATAPSRTISEDNTQITISFNESLLENDIVSFGSPLVWSTANNNLEIHTNCFIDPIQTYTVGLTCGLEEEIPGPGTFVNTSFNDQKILIYPNPATDILNFTEKVKKATIYSLQGQMLLSQTDINVVNISDLAKGMYIVHLIDDFGNKTSSKIEVR